MRTLYVWHPDMGPSLRSGITVCLALALGSGAHCDLPGRYQER